MFSDSRVITGSALLLRQGRQAPFVTQVPLLDRLEEGGLPRGTLIELSGKASTGRFALSLAALSAATRAGEPAALIDLGDHLDPEGAHAAGVDLSRLLWVRPFTVKEAMTAAEMILLAGFSLVVLDLAEKKTEHLSDGPWIRLSRAARAQNAVLLLSSPLPLAGTAADLSVTACRSRPVWLGSGSAPRLLSGLRVDFTLQRRKGGRRAFSGALFLPVHPIDEEIRGKEKADAAADRLSARP
ncbi:MAG: hypothetical protein HY282_12790 [Nitrospirae bacterium]|nr:hypothetical protein [Candidatus Manganitrophaceae bacterium]